MYIIYIWINVLTWLLILLEEHMLLHEAWSKLARHFFNCAVVTMVVPFSCITDWLCTTFFAHHIALKWEVCGPWLLPINPTNIALLYIFIFCFSNMFQFWEKVHSNDKVEGFFNFYSVDMNINTCILHTFRIYLIIQNAFLNSVL